MFLFNINVWVSKQIGKNTHTFLVKRGVATKRCFFLWTCVLQNVKSYRFVCPFLGNFGWCSKRTIKKGISGHFWKQKSGKTMTIFKRHDLVQGRVIIWSKLVSPPKKANLDQIITIKNCASTLLFKKYLLKSLFLWCFWQTLLKQQTWSR